MYIKNIELKNFRNYDELKLNFDKNVNLILGMNAQGKTNLIEAVYVSSIGRSFRTSKDSDLIGFDKEQARVLVETVRDEDEGSVEILFRRDQKKFAKVNGIKINKSSELLKNVYIVIFSPEDLKIVKDEPEKRRKFIDRELCQIKPAYYDALSNCKKILNQRNAYLKEFEINPSIIDIWDIQLAACGASIIQYRNEFVKKISDIGCEIHSGITNGREKLTIKYAPNIRMCEDKKTQEELFYDILKSSYENDLRQRSTTKGPHKDDIEFFIDGINVRSFGSQGQQRTAALSLKLAEISIIREESGEAPILLLDDVMSELDIQRQEYLVKTLSQVQLFITTTEIPDILKEKFPHARTYYVENGSIREMP